MSSAKIFICYRRNDSTSYARLLYQDLRRRFGDHDVFMDLRIGLGANFVAEVEREISACAVLLVVIGPEWLTAADEHGDRRLDDPDDLVRLEIEKGLERGVVVIPLFVRGARMPKAGELPASLAPLRVCNGLAIHDEHWDDDVRRVARTVRATLGEEPTPADDMPSVVRVRPVAVAEPPPPAAAAAAERGAEHGQAVAVEPSAGGRSPRSRLALGLLALAALLAIGAVLLLGQGEQESETVRIGLINTLSGQNGAAGTDSLRGVQLAIDYVNDDGYPDLGLPLHPGAGLPGRGGAKLALAVKDVGDPTVAGERCKAGPALDQLVTREHVTAVIGAYASTVTLQLIAAANARRIPLVNDTSTAETLTEADGNTGPRRTVCGASQEDPTPSPWFSRISTTDRQFAELFESFIADRAAHAQPVRSIAILHESNDVYGEAGAHETAKFAARLGIPVQAFPYDSRSTSEDPNARCPLERLVSELQSQVTRIKALRPDAVFALSYLPDAVATVQVMKRQGYSPPALLAYGAGYADPAFIGQAMAGNRACDLPQTDPRGIITRAAFTADKDDATRRVSELFERRFGTPITGTSARSFTAALALAEALDKAGSNDPARIQRALRALRVRAADTILPGGIVFDASGQNRLARGVLMQIQSGSYVTVYPPKLATAAAVWPLKAAPG